MKKILLGMVMGMLMVACGTTKKSQSEEQKAVSIQFSADSAYVFCAAQCQYGPRTMNSEAHEKCGEWIVEKFKQYVAECCPDAPVFMVCSRSVEW